MNNNSKKIIFIPVIALALVIVGITYAFYELVVNNTSLAGETNCYTINYTKGQDIVSELEPGADYNSGKSTDIVMYQDTTCGPMTGRLYITTNEESTMDFSDNALRYTVLLNGDIVSEGAINGTENQIIYDNFDLNTTETTYQVYVWLDESLEDTSNTLDESYSGFIHAEAIMTSDRTPPPSYAQIDESGANAPAYIENLIPVMYDTTTNDWVVADTTSSTSTYGWYDYDEKKWANAVLLTETKRNSLTKTGNNYTPGQAIGDSEAEGVLAFYVWIPRYKYKVWNIDKIADINQFSYDAYNKGVEIEFIGKDEEGTITCDYSYAAPSANAGEPNEECSDVENGTGYYTHPAFKFGDDILTGIWVGKFELSSEVPNSYDGGGETATSPRILPNVTPWIAPVTYLWKVINEMQNDDNIYGLSINKKEADSHMLTNMEWGVVAYFAHSKYGRCTGGESSVCTEIAFNSIGLTATDQYTGRSSGVDYSLYWDLYENSYGEINTASYTYDGKDASTMEYATDRSLGMNASTTGNIYGIYDMSGGGYEYVMGNMGTSTGQSSLLYEYYPREAGIYYTYTGNEKYLTTYAYGDDPYYQSAYNRGRLGDATSEFMIGLDEYGEGYFSFPNYDNPWLFRGFTRKNYNVIFSFGLGDGGSDYCSRPVLVSLAV